MVDLKEPDVVESTEDSGLCDQEILKRLRNLRIVNIWAVRVFFAVLFCVAVIALIIPLRPTFSEAEKRELQKFPKFTFSSLASGDYFVGIDNWYSDTFPQRDFFAELNAKVTSLFGFSSTKIHGEVETGDAIPSVDTVTSSEESVSSETVSSVETVSSTPSQSEVSSESEVVSSAPENSVAEQGNETPPPAQTPPPPTTQTMGALLINGDTAYEYYNFNKKAADKYAAAINRAAELLAGQSTVYDIIVPTSMGITAPDELVKNINTSNQQDAINYMNSLLSGSVVKVPIFDEMKARKNEYIYFRTDHHWTALGAYYAYAKWATVKGITPTSLDNFKKHEYSGFLGSFYTSSKKIPQLASKPDTVFAYEPVETNSIRICSSKTGWYYSKIISDMSAAPSSSKYISFIRGDNPLSYVTNPNITDNSSCLVIKESFGNAFVPFLVSHYQTVYIVDYRYFADVDSRGLAQYCKELNINDVIFINNISATRNIDLVNTIDALVR